MITLSEIMLWLKTKTTADFWSRESINPANEKAIALYSRQSERFTQAIMKIKTYRTAQYSLLIHWNKNADESELVANTIFQMLEDNTSGYKIGNHRVISLAPVYAGPIALGKDENKIYEYSIDFYITYEKEGE